MAQNFLLFVSLGLVLTNNTILEIHVTKWWLKSIYRLLFFCLDIKFVIIAHFFEAININIAPHHIYLTSIPFRRHSFNFGDFFPVVHYWLVFNWHKCWGCKRDTHTQSEFTTRLVRLWFYSGNQYLPSTFNNGGPLQGLHLVTLLELYIGWYPTIIV